MLYSLGFCMRMERLWIVSHCRRLPVKWVLWDEKSHKSFAKALTAFNACESQAAELSVSLRNGLLLPHLTMLLSSASLKAGSASIE